MVTLTKKYVSLPPFKLKIRVLCFWHKDLETAVTIDIFFWKVFFHCMFLSKAVCPVNSGLVPELPSSPQEAREPQPQLQHPHDLAAAQPHVAAHPHARGAAVHSLRGPRGVHALCTTLLHRQWEPDFLWFFTRGIFIDFFLCSAKCYNRVSEDSRSCLQGLPQ